MPVRWEVTATETPQTLNLQANGAITASVQPPIGSHCIFPWLTIDRGITDIQCTAPANESVTTELHPLEDSQRLVATTLAENPPTEALFPGSPIVLVHLTANPPIQGPALAWQTLDALITSPETFSAIPPQTRQNLYLAGVTLAVHGDWPPDDPLPHQRVAGFNVARLTTSLPPLLTPDAYAPIEGWTPGRSAEDRRHIFLLGTIYLLLFLSCLLLRGRWIIYALIPMTALTCLLFARDNSNRSPVAQIAGDVNLLVPPANIEDHWRYFTAPSPATLHVSARGLCEPFLYDRTQARQMSLQLNCDADGNPDFLTAQMRPGDALAICTRQPAVAPLQFQTPVNSPLRLLAGSAAYPDFTLAGQAEAPAQPDLFPTIVLKRLGN
jgi:hypothetical protein